MSPASRLARTAGVLLALPAAFAFCYAYRPIVHDGPVVCVWRILLGMPCPMCGITRAFCHFSHGEFAQGFQYNPIAPLMLVYLLGIWAFRARAAWTRRPAAWPTATVNHLMMIAIVSFYAARLSLFFGSGATIDPIWSPSGAARLWNLIP